MSKNTDRSKKTRKKHNIPDFEIEQDENFSFIAGYTSGGFSYGTKWKETDMELDEGEDVFG